MLFITLPTLNELLTEKTTFKLPSNVQSGLLGKVMLMMLRSETAFPCGNYKIIGSKEKHAIT
jgi:hypothetical protein